MTCLKRTRAADAEEAERLTKTCAFASPILWIDVLAARIEITRVWRKPGRAVGAGEPPPP